MTIIGIAAGVVVLLIFLGMLFSICGPAEGYNPMSYDEEVEWLMEQGLTKEEAEEIADIR